MNKKGLSMIVIGVVIGIIVLGVVGFIIFGGDDADSPEGDSIIDRKITKLSTEKRFVQFGADIICARFEYIEALREIKDDPDSGAKRTELTEEYKNATVLITEKYGYTEDEAERLGEEHVEDLDYAESVIERVKDLCPEAAPELEENIEIMKSGMYVKITINEEMNSAKIEYKYFEDGYINEGSRSCSANIEDIHNTLQERMGKELADKAMEVAIFEYE